MRSDRRTIMARTLTAYLKRDDAPQRAALQAAIKALTFPLTLDDDYVPFETAGYLPCTIDGEDAGFDLKFKEAAAELPEALKASAGDRDTAMAMTWGGDPREAAAAYMVCAALAKDFGALVHEGGTETLLTADAVVAKAKEAAAAC
jgi:hypothetical protein